MKSVTNAEPVTHAASLPVRGAWIEMDNANANARAVIDGRSPCGERGLKYTERNASVKPSSVAPRAGSVD